MKIALISKNKKLEYEKEKEEDDEREERSKIKIKNNFKLLIIKESVFEFYLIFLGILYHLKNYL